MVVFRGGGEGGEGEGWFGGADSVEIDFKVKL